MPARFVLLVLQLLAVELLLAGHESGGLLLDVFVAALDPGLQLLPLAFDGLQLLRELAANRFELLGLLGDFGERLAIMVGELGADHRDRSREAGWSEGAR